MEIIDLMPAAQTFRLVATLDLPDEKRQVDRLIVRNLPDEPKRRFGT